MAGIDSRETLYPRTLPTHLSIGHSMKNITTKCAQCGVSESILDKWDMMKHWCYFFSIISQETLKNNKTNQNKQNKEPSLYKKEHKDDPNQTKRGQMGKYNSIWNNCQVLSSICKVYDLSAILTDGGSSVFLNYAPPCGRGNIITNLCIYIVYPLCVLFGMVMSYCPIWDNVMSL